MGRKRVVVGGDDRESGSPSFAQGLLVVSRAGGEAVREIGASEPLAGSPLGDCGVDPVEIGASRAAAALGDPSGDFADPSVEFSHASLLRRKAGGTGGASVRSDTPPTFGQ
jgi:hypothetical protein